MSKKFTFGSFSQGTVHKDTHFGALWPQLQPKTYASSLDLYLKGLETKLLKQAREKALDIEKEAYEKGFAQGEKDGLELGQRRLEVIIQQVKNVLAEIERQREDLFRIFEKEMLQLVLSICKKVLHHELTLHEDVITLTLQKAFQYVVDRRKVIVHLNPVDCRHLLSHPEKFPFVLEEEGGVKVVEDHLITRGGCFLETSSGEMDGTIESQLDEIASLIWERPEKEEQSSLR